MISDYDSQNYLKTGECPFCQGTDKAEDRPMQRYDDFTSEYNLVRDVTCENCGKQFVEMLAVVGIREKETWE